MNKVYIDFKIFCSKVNLSFIWFSMNFLKTFCVCTLRRLILTEWQNMTPITHILLNRKLNFSGRSYTRARSEFIKWSKPDLSDCKICVYPFLHNTLSSNEKAGLSDDVENVMVFTVDSRVLDPEPWPVQVVIKIAQTSLGNFKLTDFGFSM